MTDEASQARDSELERLSDHDLLTRLIQERDQEAFRVIVLRYGPLVMRVCRGVLRDGHDADDAYQATFLVLAEKARKIRRRTSLVSWLQGTAYRVSLRVVRQNRQKRLTEEYLEQDMSIGEQLRELVTRDQEWMLQEELSRLPEKYRGPIVLCYLEGKTREEAARLLDCTVSAVKGRLEKGRQRLRASLTSRGVTLGSLLPIILGSTAQLAAIPESLISATVETGANCIGTGTIPPHLLGLMRGESVSVMVTSTKYALGSSLIAIVLLMCSLLISKNTSASDTSRLTTVVVAPKAAYSSRAVSVALNSVAADSQKAKGTNATGAVKQTPVQPESASAARALVQRYAEGQGWLTNYSMQVRARSHLQGYSDGRPTYQEKEATILNRADRIAVWGEHSTFEREGGQRDQKRTFRQVATDEWWLNRSGGTGGIRSKRIDYYKNSAMYEQTSLGMALDGYFVGNDGYRLAEVLQDCPRLTLLRTEPIEGTQCAVIQADSVYGDITVWLAEDTHLPLRVISKKGPQHKWREGTILKDDDVYTWDNQDLIGYECEVTNVRWDRKEEWFVPTSGEIRITYKMSAGRNRTASTEVDRDDITISPDPSPSDFAMDFVDGARINDWDDPKSGSAYIWRDGEMIPEDDIATEIPSRVTPTAGRWRWIALGVVTIGAVIATAFIGWRGARNAR